MIPRYRTDDACAGKPYPDEPFILDCRWSDIPRTLTRAMKTLPENCVGISIRITHDMRELWQVERQARKQNLRVFWIKTTKFKE